MSFPKSLNYAVNKQMSGAGRPEILRYRSQNASYQSGDKITIEIPTGRSGMHLFAANSYIEAKIIVNVNRKKEALKFNIDQNIYSIFKNIRVLHGTSQLEQYSSCNRLWNCIYDLQRNKSEREGDTLTIMGGSDTLRTAGYEFDFAAIVADETSFNSDPIEFAFVIPSAILGCLGSKALPLGLMGASSIYLELELEAAGVALYAQDASIVAFNSFTVSDIYYNAKCVMLPSDVENLIIQSTGGSIVLPAVSYKSEIKALSSGSSTFNDKYSFQFSSIKNFMFFFINTLSYNGTLTKRAVTSRQSCGLKEYNLNLNGINFPSQPISGTSKSYMELLRSYDMMTDTNSGGILSRPNYGTGSGANANDTYSATVNYRSLYGLDLDRFNHSSETLLSGTDTIGSSVNLVCNFSASTPANITVTAFVMYDILYTLNGGLLSAKW